MNRIALFLRNSYLHLFLRLFVGGTFVLSAISKFPHHTQFVDIVKGYNLLPDALATAYANALPWVELLVGVYLLLGILVRPGALVTILMGISFMVANIKSLVRGDEQCGHCFGDTIVLPVGQALTIDIFLLIAAAILMVAAGKSLFTLDRFLLRRDDSV
jgi:uncharacterized membrane protein YphA (DoxX/SURF4 family)